MALVGFGALSASFASAEKVYDGETGELLEKVDGFFSCDECESLEEFEERHGDDLLEYFENKLKYDYSGMGALVRMDVVALADDYEDEDEDEDDGEDCK